MSYNRNIVIVIDINVYPRIAHVTCQHNTHTHNSMQFASYVQVVGLESDIAVAQRLHIKSKINLAEIGSQRWPGLLGKARSIWGLRAVISAAVKTCLGSLDITWHWNGTNPYKSCLHELCMVYNMYYIYMVCIPVYVIQSSSIRTLLLCQGDLEIWRWDSRKWTQPRLTESSDVTTVGCHVWTCSSWSRARAGVDHHCGKHWWRRASALARTAFSLRRLWLAPCLQAQTAAPPSTDPFALLAWPRWQREKSWKDVSRHDRLAREFRCWKQSSQLAEGVGTWPDS